MSKLTFNGKKFDRLDRQIIVSSLFNSFNNENHISLNTVVVMVMMRTVIMQL